MILWGPFAWLVWIVLYGIPVLLAWLYLKHVAQRTGFWYTLHALVFLMLGGTVWFIASWLGTMFVVAPFIGYALAVFVASASIPILSRTYRDWWCNEEDRQDVSFAPPRGGDADPKSHQPVRCGVTISAEEARSGTRKVIHRNGKSLEVSVPPGVTTGNVVRLTNALEITDERPGAILVEIRIRDTASQGGIFRMNAKTKITLAILIVLLTGAVAILLNQQLTIAGLESEIPAYQEQIADLESELQTYQTQIADLESELQGYRDTGIRIHDSEDLPRIFKYVDVIDLEKGLEDSDYVSLVNNTNAVNPTFDQLMSFLEQDSTDTYTYMEGYLIGRICGWFAERVHNNAEQAGIKAAFVAVNFVDTRTGHALNAFNTVDRGLVFIDCTGKSFGRASLRPIDPSIRTYKIGDTRRKNKIAYIDRGRPIGWINIGMPYGLDYSEYERWQSDVDAMRRRFAEADTHEELSQIVIESNSTLGSFFAASDEIVESIEIYW